MRCSICGWTFPRGSSTCPTCGTPSFGLDATTELLKRYDFTRLLDEAVNRHTRDLAPFDSVVAASRTESQRLTETVKAIEDGLTEQTRRLSGLSGPWLAKLTRTLEPPKLPGTFELTRAAAEAAHDAAHRLLQSVPTLPALDLVQKQADQLEQIRTLVEQRYSEWQTTWQSGFGDLTASIAEAADLLRATTISSSERGLVVDGVAVGVEEIAAFLAGQEDLELETLVRQAEHNEKPRGRAIATSALIWFLQYILIQFLISFAAADAHRVWREHVAQRKAVTRVLKQAAEQRAARVLESGIPREILLRYRLVTAGTLNVRAGPARKSQKLGEVHLGDIVYAIRTTKRSWTLIEWAPAASQAHLRGWVFSRYLDKLRLPKPLARQTLEPAEPPLVASH